MRSISSYNIGNHTIALQNSIAYNFEKYHAEYRPFLLEENKGEVLFSIQVNVVENIENKFSELFTSFELEDASCKIFSTKDQYAIEITTDADQQSRLLIVDHKFSEAQAYLLGESTSDALALNDYLMILYSFASAYQSTLLFHASTIVYNNKAYLFLGKSGTGKSTHSRLWLENIPNAELLNDDNPAVRIIDNKVLTFGTAWSGKTPCYKNEVYELGGIVRLKQAPENKIRQMNKVQAYANVLPSCSYLRQIIPLRDSVYQSIAYLAEHIPVYELECLPNADAAKMCFNKIAK